MQREYKIFIYWGLETMFQSRKKYLLFLPGSLRERSEKYQPSTWFYMESAELAWFQRNHPTEYNNNQDQNREIQRKFSIFSILLSSYFIFLTVLPNSLLFC